MTYCFYIMTRKFKWVGSLGQTYLRPLVFQTLCLETKLQIRSSTVVLTSFEDCHGLVCSLRCSAVCNVFSILLFEHFELMQGTLRDLSKKQNQFTMPSEVVSFSLSQIFASPTTSLKHHNIVFITYTGCCIPIQSN